MFGWLRRRPPVVADEASLRKWMNLVNHAQVSQADKINQLGASLGLAWDTSRNQWRIVGEGLTTEQLHQELIRVINDNEERGRRIDQALSKLERALLQLPIESEPTSKDKPKRRLRL